MPTKQFRLPKLAEGEATGSIVKILVASGDRVAVDDTLLEIETDKAVVEVPSTVAGVVREVHVKVGDDVGEGALVATFETDADASAAAPPAAAAQASAPAEPPAPPATVPAPPEPTPAQAPTAEPPAARPALSVIRPSGEPGRAIPAAPSVRRFARELGLDIAQVPGSGAGGRISIADVQAFQRRQNQRGPAGGFAQAAPLPDFSRFGPVERVPLTGVRRATAQHLGQSWPNVPQVTQFDEADVTDLEHLRARYGPRIERLGGKLTVTAILLKIVAHALERFPKFNASIDMAQNEIVMKHYCHIGVAVDTERGLLVPVIRDVDQKNIQELAVELGAVAERARSAKLSPDEMQGGCFSISNLGGIGGTGFTPVVNAPEAAILGISRTTVRPVLVDGQLGERSYLPLSLSYDHRLIDGADAARFLRWVAEALESPFLLALEG